MATTGKVKILPKTSKLSKISGYNGEMGILTTNHELAFHLVACKEEFYTATSKHLGWLDSNLQDKAADVLPGAPVAKNKTIYTKSARLVMIYRDSVGRKKVANRVLDVVEKLRKRLRLKYPTTVSYSADPKSPAMLIDCDKFFLRSPVSQSAIMTFIRGSMNTTFEYKTLNGFIKKLIAIMSADEDFDGDDYYDDYSSNAMDDAEHLMMARENDTLDAFLKRKLPCIRRKGFSDCRFYRNDSWSGQRFDGIAEYHKPKNYKEVTKTFVVNRYDELYPPHNSDTYSYSY